MKKKPIKLLGLWLLQLLIISSCTPKLYPSVEKSITTGISTSIQANASASADSLIAPYRKQLQSKMAVVLAHSQEILTKDTVESTLGNYISDALLSYIQSKKENAQIFISNSGGLRGIMPKGDVTIGDIYEILPFENELVILTVNGTQLQSLFKIIAERKNICQAGMQLELDRKGKLISGQIAGKPIDLTKTYNVLTSDYLANGGDNMGFLVGAYKKTLSLKLRDAMIEYLKINSTIEITSKKDRRVILK